jgi:hypothetical protein
VKKNPLITCDETHWEIVKSPCRVGFPKGVAASSARRKAWRPLEFVVLAPQRRPRAGKQLPIEHPPRTRLPKGGVRKPHLLSFLLPYRAAWELMTRMFISL